MGNEGPFPGTGPDTLKLEDAVVHGVRRRSKKFSALRPYVRGTPENASTADISSHNI